MPFSLDPQPAENEIECANCGALIPDDVGRCPNCGINLYEPEHEPELIRRQPPKTRRASRLDKLLEPLKRLLGKPSPAEELFGAFLRQQSGLYNDLLLKVGGDPQAVERLVEFERQLLPRATRTEWLRNAIARWERDNRKL